MEEVRDGFILSTGKKVYANNQIIGLSPPKKSGRWVISEGYDGTIDGDLGYEDELTNFERLEVADYMIRLWQRYRDAHEAN